MIIQSGWKDNPKITIYRLYVLLSEWTDNILDYTFIIVVWERVYSYTEKRESGRRSECWPLCSFLFASSNMSFRLDLVQSSVNKSVQFVLSHPLWNCFPKSTPLSNIPWNWSKEVGLIKWLISCIGVTLFSHLWVELHPWALINWCPPLSLRLQQEHWTDDVL